ncbi:hypothetical protein BKN38_00410 [Helicobacter sp. CLO-3]|uniref:dynamin family protein n=1 Tax=unclassified Helicobacter TaxID=2593540 RepID=UPI000804FD89|nr:MULTISPECIES: dynamin family protein [unclassified Helicobacter]OBV28416.1 hypothetical protein BA723_02230 [Helicobacter sp. CLO-3]OHU85898.1 hypothetical protein BKN38_00410 [Helicobacter sp. CLO-3]
MKTNENMKNVDSGVLDFASLDSGARDKNLESKTLDSTTDLLERFIKECLINTSQSPLQKLIAQTRYTLSHYSKLSAHASNELARLESIIDESIKIAIVGQFSSGKSTFLNALLGREILPSGITPITSKVCEIRYGEAYELEVRYKDSSIKHKPLSFLHTLDELENTHISDFRLYAPNEMLRQICFLDTPGFNSQNAIDTQTTNQILESVDGIIWLSLIDNVGKQSEKDILQVHIKKYAAKSICVLNQKDRLKNEDEVKTSLEYAKRAFEGFFGEVVAISAKLGLCAQISTRGGANGRAGGARGESINVDSGSADSTLDSSAPANTASTTAAPRTLDSALCAESNMQSVIDFIRTNLTPNAKALKTLHIKKSLKAMLLSALCHTQNAKKSLESLLEELALQDGRVRFGALQSGLEKRFGALFVAYNSLLESLAQEIFTKMQSQEIQLPITTKNKLGMRTTTLEKKSAPYLPKDMLISRLCSEEEASLREFRKVGFALSEFGEAFGEMLGAQARELDSKIARIKLCFLPEALAESRARYFRDFGAINEVSTRKILAFSSVLESIARDYEKAGQKILSSLKSELFALRTLITLNYANAITLALTKLDAKMEYALKKHLQNPKDFALFTPTLENIRDELNAALHFLVFQDKLFLQNSLYKRALWEIGEEYEKSLARAREAISATQNELQEYRHTLKSQLATIRSQNA